MSRSLFFSLLDLLTWFLKEGKENKFTDMTSRRKKKGGVFSLLLNATVRSLVKRSMVAVYKWALIPAQSSVKRMRI